MKENEIQATARLCLGFVLNAAPGLLAGFVSVPANGVSSLEEFEKRPSLIFVCVALLAVRFLLSQIRCWLLFQHHI